MEKVKEARCSSCIHFIPEKDYSIRGSGHCELRAITRIDSGDWVSAYYKACANYEKKKGK